MRTENPKQISIVNKGKELFWKYGIRRVSIEEICREARVSKMTFYKYFKNKNSLVIYIFENLSKDQIKVYREFWESDIPMEEKVQRTIRMKLDSTDHVSMDLVLDIYKSGDQELQDYFNQRTQEMLDIVRYDYREAQDKGLLRQDFSIDFIMYLMNHLGEMISDQKLTSLYSDSSSLLRDLLEFFYYGIMPKSNNKVS